MDNYSSIQKIRDIQDSNDHIAYIDLSHLEIPINEYLALCQKLDINTSELGLVRDTLRYLLAEANFVIEEVFKACKKTNLKISTMCSMGIHRSVWLAKCAENYGVEVSHFNKANSSLQYSLYEMAFDGIDIFRVSNEEVFIGQSQEPTDLLMIALADKNVKETDYLKTQVLATESLPANFKILYIQCSESVMDFIVPHFFHNKAAASSGIYEEQAAAIEAIYNSPNNA